MLEEIIGGLSARSGGECTVAVAGAPGAGKSSFVRGVARALSLTLDEEKMRAEGELGGAGDLLLRRAGAGREVPRHQHGTGAGHVPLGDAKPQGAARTAKFPFRAHLLLVEGERKRAGDAAHE